MKILTVHEFYRQPGGEDEVFVAEAELLTESGHEVHEFTLTHEKIDREGQLGLALKTCWNQEEARNLRRAIRATRPDLVHFHNIFPLLSPAALRMASRAGLPVVQTLHNYRLFCVNGLYLRQGSICTDCSGRLPVPGLIHACYRSSRAASGAVLLMTALHRTLRTWVRNVDAFIAPTSFARGRMIEGGLPGQKVHVKSNPVRDPGFGTGDGGYALFVGRLSDEKGVRTLMEAWRMLGSECPPLRILGDGPLMQAVRGWAQGVPGIEVLGHVQRELVHSAMREATFLLFPSICYETMGLVVAEGLGAGLPAIVPSPCAAQELVDEGRTGWIVESGSPEALADAVRRVVKNKDDLRATRRNCREAFEKNHSQSANLKQLLGVYESAMSAAKSRV